MRSYIKKTARVISMLACCLSLSVHSDDTPPEISKVSQVSNLAYGTSLYNFFQDKYFSAITDLLIAKHHNRLNTQDKNAELLLGGMYLSYGLPDKAAGIFTELLDQSSSDTHPEVRDRALFHLGRHYYESDSLQAAESSLLEIGDTLGHDYMAERMYMLINILIHQQQTDNARTILDEIPDSIWQYYAKYNVGTASLRSNQFDEGKTILDTIGSLKTNHGELEIIRDKANIALAFAELSRNHPQQAGEYFNRVRIQGSQTANGLLGLGWSWYQQAHYHQALNAWLTLSQQPNPSLAKQESLITIPYAHENAGQPQLALDAYDIAIDSYHKELVHIARISDNIKSGEFIRALETVSLGTESSNPATVIDNVGEASNQYLAHLFMSRDFHMAVKDLQELVFLSYTLSHWEQDIPALRLILEEKRITYNREIEKQNHKKILARAKDLFKQRNDLNNRVQQIESGENLYAVSSEVEKALLDKLNTIRSTLESARNDKTLGEQNEKFRLLNGRLQWKLTTEYPERIWQIKKELIALNKTAEEFNRIVNDLSNIFSSRPGQYVDFLARIKKREAELESLKRDIASAISHQEQVISAMSLSAAEHYASKIEAYLDRAMYSRARLYDAMTIPQASTN